MHIRRAMVDDSPALAHIQVDSYRAAYAGILPADYLAQFTYQEQEQDWRDLLASQPNLMLYVAETEAGCVVGYVFARPGPSGLPSYDSELVALHVRHSSQKQGIGRQLVHEVAGQLRQEGCSSMMLWVLEKNASRGFYERLGAHLLGATQDFVGATEVAYGWAADPFALLASPDRPCSLGGLPK